MGRQEEKQTTNREFNPGTLLNITSGEYSDYNVHGLVRVRKYFTHALLYEALCEALGEQDAWAARGDVDLYMVLPWLIREGWVEEVECEELWLGAYSSLDKPEGA